MTGSPRAVELREVSRTYTVPTGEVAALRDVTLAVSKGEALAVTGPSGSGKTTLLNLVAGLDRPTSGQVITLGRDLHRLREAQLTAFRARSIGLVFQDPCLLPGLTALENVVVARLPWGSRRTLVEEAGRLLDAVGLSSRRDFPPARLSGGERQRVGIARALVGTPSLLLADEPTGNLDDATTADILALLRELRGRFGFTFVVATHDPAVSGMADRVMRLVGGSIAATPAPAPSAHNSEAAAPRTFQHTLQP
ncbi:MAG TPA: ABC transporter ATP-binding protein [Actinomycetota bacterium]